MGGNDTLYAGTLQESGKESDELSCGDGEDTVYLSDLEHSGHDTDASCETVIAH
jgi:hypothetical protein